MHRQANRLQGGMVALLVLSQTLVLLRCGRDALLKVLTLEGISGLAQLGFEGVKLLAQLGS